MLLYSLLLFVVVVVVVVVCFNRRSRTVLIRCVVIFQEVAWVGKTEEMLKEEVTLTRTHTHTHTHTHAHTHTLANYIAD